MQITPGVLDPNLLYFFTSFRSLKPKEAQVEQFKASTSAQPPPCFQLSVTSSTAGWGCGAGLEAPAWEENLPASGRLRLQHLVFEKASVVGMCGQDEAYSPAKGAVCVSTLVQSMKVFLRGRKVSMGIC